MSEPPGSIVLLRRVPAGVRRAALERFARLLRDSVAGGAAFECLITGDSELRRLNLEFRGKDYATDVLSFPAPTQPGASAAFLGSLAISVQRAAAQAREHGHRLDQELRILMLHGLLHLLGMDHERDRGKMARAETRWRERLGLPAGLIERVRA